MPRFCQVVMGPAGSGKSTYCSTIVKHCVASRRTVHVVNLDPAAEQFDYPVLADVRDLISVDDVMEDESLRFGPNGGLIFCMEYFAQNFDWLEEALGDIEDDYIIFDCPGQIELYTHVPVMKQFITQLQSWNFYICGIFVIDAQFMIEPTKFVSGVMTALSTMVNLEISHINVMSKLDLLNKKARKELERYLEPNMKSLLTEEMEEGAFGLKFKKLNSAIANLIDDYSLVNFVPLDITDEDSISDLLMQVDTCLQYFDEIEPKEPKDYQQYDEDGDEVIDKD